MHVEADPLVRLYAHAEALRATATRLPEDQGGLALLLSLQADDIERIVSGIDEGWQPKPTPNKQREAQPNGAAC